MSPDRVLTPYEKTVLLRAGFNPDDADTLQKLANGPVEYLVGKVVFGTREFLVTPDVLIPRPETEELVEMAIQIVQALPGDKTVKLADIGTGCGAIALTLAEKLSQANRPHQLWASDVSPSAIQVALSNVRDRVYEKQIKWLASDLLASFPANLKFDLIVANLPYIPSQRVNRLDTSVKDYEPRVALDGGPTGFELIDQLIHQAPAHLVAGGQVLLEVDYTHNDHFFRQYYPDWQVKISFDHALKVPFVVMKRLESKS